MEAAVPWLLPVADHDEPGEICNLLCSLCLQHKVTQRSGAGTLVSKLCAVLLKDVIDCHSQSNMLKEALYREATRLSIMRHGGIEHAFPRQVYMCAEKGFDWCFKDCVHTN